MTQELHDHCTKSIAEHRALVFTPDQLVGLSPSDAAEIQQEFGSRALFRLPEHEIAFFEWLRQQEPAVWTDLWGEQEQAPYLVSAVYIKDFIGAAGTGAFLICDLQSQDNYFFTPDMLLEKESTDFVNAVRQRFLDGDRLTVEQALTVEISTGPVDIWHFAYLRGVDLDRAKKAVASLVEDRIIVHVPLADHLSSFFDVG